MTQRPRTAVVIVTHQTCDEALTCLASLDGEQADVVVVDTGSSDGTAEAVRAAHPDVRVLELANAGFGRGANAGVRVTSAPYVVVANADVRFGPASVQHLADALDEDPSLGVVGPAVFYPDGQPQASARRLPDPITAIAHGVLGRLAPANRWTRRYRALDHPHTQAREADWLSGCTLALRRGAFEQVGGFDPGFHLYVEDIDLAVRLRAAGWRLRFEPDAWVEHDVGASTSAARWRALVTHARSLDLFLRRHHAGALAVLVRPALRVGLVAWAVVTWAWERTLGGGHSPTGERQADIP